MDTDDVMSVVQESHAINNQHQTPYEAISNRSNIDVWMRSRTQEEVICHVVSLVDQLYHSTSSENLDQANRQLVEIQSSSA